MKILFVTMNPLEYNTSANIRNAGLIKGLQLLGHSIDTMSLRPDKNSIGFDESIVRYLGKLSNRYYFEPSSIYSSVRNKKQAEKIPSPALAEKADGTIKAFIKHWRKFLMVCSSRFLIYDIQKINLSNVKKCKIKFSGYDLVISSSDPKSAHLIAEILLKKIPGKSSWIQYWGDPMADDINFTGGSLKRTLAKREEERILAQASRIVYTSPFTLEKQKKMFPACAGKMCYTPQACLENECNRKKKNETADILKIGYFGAYMPETRNLEPLCQTILKRKEDFVLYVAGVGNCGVKEDNIRYVSKLSYEETKKLEEQSDILICLCNRKGTQIPGKIYYTAHYNKPILLITDGENKEHLKKYFDGMNRYIVCGNTPAEINRALNQAAKEAAEGKNYDIPKQLFPINVAKKVLER